MVKHERSHMPINIGYKLKDQYANLSNKAVLLYLKHHHNKQIFQLTKNLLLWNLYSSSYNK